MLTASDPPYDEATVVKAQLAATKLEQMLFEKATDAESYERKISTKLEAMSTQIVKARSKRAMEAQGLTMAEAPVKPLVAKTPPVAVERQAAPASTTSGDEYGEGRAYFESQTATLQKQMRGNVLKKWLDKNAKTSQIARDFIKAGTPQEKRKLYEEKLKPHLDVWLFKQLQAQLETQRERQRLPINAELQGYVNNLLAQEDAEEGAERDGKRQKMSGKIAVDPSPEYWLKVHELNQKYHAQLSRAFKWVQTYQTSGTKLGPIRQKFVDLLANIIMPAIEQTTANRDPNIPANMEHLVKVESAIQKALSKYEATEKAKQEQQRLKSMNSTQRAIASLTESHGGKVKSDALHSIAEACAALADGFAVRHDTLEIFNSDDDVDGTVDTNFPVDLLKDFWTEEANILPAGAPNTWTIQSGKDVVAVAFKNSGIESERIATVAEY